MPTRRRRAIGSLPVLLGLLASPSAADAQARLVEDLATQLVGGSSSRLSSGPSGFCALGTQVIFVAESPNHGRELWRSDGTAAGTQLVRDIRPGPEGSEPSAPVALGNQVYFTAFDDSRGRQVWKSDGTPEGTQVVLTLPPPPILPSSSVPFDLMRFGDAIYFLTGNSSGSPASLWRSDGTEAGTTRIAELGSNSRLVVASDRLYVLAQTALYQSDGTSAGTSLVRSGLPQITGERVTDGGVLFFVVLVGTNREAIWKSDGTSAGTVELRRTFSGVSAPRIESPTPLGGNILLFVSEHVTGQNGGVWRMNPSTGAVSKLASARDGDLAVAGANAFFAASDATAGMELWATDGTAAGTRRVADLDPGVGSSDPYAFVGFGGQVLFNTLTNLTHGRELWASDGSEAGTQRLTDIWPGPGHADPSDLTVVGDTVWFGANDGASGSEPWQSDGSAAGTRRVADVAEDVGSSNPAELTAFDGELFFKTDAGASGFWRSDGTPEGTATPRVMDARDLRVIGDELFFLSASGSNVFRPWVSDGTAAGTRLAANVRADATPIQASAGLVFPRIDTPGLWRVGVSSSSPVLLRPFTQLNLFRRPFRSAGGQVFFAADDGTGAGEELWASDGTSTGTRQVKDLVPGSAGSSIADSGVFGERYLFAARHPDLGLELWQSDGTEAGTELLVDLASGPNSSEPQNLVVAAGERVYFDTLEFSVRRLRVTDGTPAGTTTLLDPLRTNAEVISGTAFIPRAAVGRRLFFVHDDRVHGHELWVSDGTVAGTLMVKDIEPGSGSSNPTTMREVDGRLVFRACIGETGCELWVSDGTSAGTRLLDDLAPGPFSSLPGPALRVGDQLFTAAATPGIGRELWAFDLGQCGDGTKGALEECDDGNLNWGDGCSASCDVDQSWAFHGTAAGGSIQLEIEGVTLTLATIGGQGVPEILGALANLIRNHPVLGARGIQAIAEPGRLITDGQIGSAQVDDPGLVVGGPEVPALDVLGAAALGALLLGSARRRLRSAGER